MSNKPNVKQIAKGFLKLRNEAETESFLSDLLTKKELETVAKRFEGARMLANGIPFVEIERATGLSSATISKINEKLKYGYEGYDKVFKRLKLA